MTADTQAQGDLAEAVARLQAYATRRKQSRGLDIDSIHGFDVGPVSGFELRLSDIEAVLAAALQGRAQEGEPSDAADAARYRWLRERNSVLDDSGIFTAIRVTRPDGAFDHNDLIALDEMDAAIDEARAALAQAQKERNHG